MISIPTLEITKLSSNRFRADWTIVFTEGDLSDVSDFFFDIFRSEAPNDAFTKIGFIDGDSAPGMYFTDPDKQILNNQFRYFKIHARHKTDPLNHAWSVVRHVCDDPDGTTSAIIYRNELLLGFFNGEPCTVLLAKVSGQRCSECWDGHTLKPVEFFCKTCFGTGYTGGFHNPIHNVMIHIDPSPKISNIRTENEDQEKMLQAWLSNNPLLKSRDVISSQSENKRYRVIRSDRTQKKHLATVGTMMSKIPVISRQVLTLQEINYNDIEYDVDLLPASIPSTGWGQEGYGEGYFWTEGGV